MTNPRGNFRDERLDALAGTRGNKGSRAVRQSELSDQVLSVGGALVQAEFTSRSAALGADVALTVTDQWYDGPFIALTAGIWLVVAEIQHRNDAAAVAGQIAVRIWNGSDDLASAEQTNDAVSGSSRHMSLSAVVSVKVNTVLTLQARSSAGSANSKVKATAPAAGSATTATRILAMRFGG